MASLLRLLLLAATLAVAAATAESHKAGGSRSCSSLEAFLRASPKFDFVVERLRKLPRRDVTLLLPLTSVPSGSWLRAGLPRKVVNDFVRNLVLVGNYASVEALVEAGSATTLAGTQVIFTLTDGRVYAEFEGLAGARGLVLPLARAFKRATVFSVANDQLLGGPAAPSNATAAPGRRLAGCGCDQAYCTARITCCGTCTSMTTDRHGLQSGVCSWTSGAVC